jgi:two-component sensor histidine kinase
LKEIHHRVKNNLAVISSLLNLQAKRSRSSNVHNAIRDSQVRVRAMALIHETLYQQDDLTLVPFEVYTRKLIRGLRSIYKDVVNQVSIVFDIEEIYLDISRSVCLGLILNELVTNCLKYAFPNRQKGEIRIFARLVDDTRMKLRLKDDGVGLPPGFDATRSETLGLRIVSLMVDQLQGSLEIYNEEGLEVKMVCRIR